MEAETFEILDGVRRAKAHQLLGKTTIIAEIMDEEGNTVEVRAVAIADLRVTTKNSIDVSTQVDWERFMKIFELVKSAVPAPILVTFGARGKTLDEIALDSTGVSDRS